jgi:hypothetical protein
MTMDSSRSQQHGNSVSDSMPLQVGADTVTIPGCVKLTRRTSELEGRGPDCYHLWRPQSPAGCRHQKAGRCWAPAHGWLPAAASSTANTGLGRLGDEVNGSFLEVASSEESWPRHGFAPPHATLYAHMSAISSKPLSRPCTANGAGGSGSGVGACTPQIVPMQAESRRNPCSQAQQAACGRSPLSPAP